MTYGTYRVNPPNQRQPLDERQVQNNAGGFVYSLDQWKQLDRFLILGTSGGTYYVNQQTLTLQNSKVVVDCIKADGLRAAQAIYDVSFNGRAVSNEPAIYALALCVAYGDLPTRKFVYRNLSAIVRTGTMLFHFVAHVKSMKKWGRGVRDAVSRWYNDKPASSTAYQCAKYRQRDGWTHKDVLRLAHVKPNDVSHGAVYDWVVKGWEPKDFPKHAPSDYGGSMSMIYGLELIANTPNISEGALIKAIQDYHLTWEFLPTSALNYQGVWEALLPNLPITALTRNLGKMSAIDLFVGKPHLVQAVCDRFTKEAVKKARLHPLSTLIALKTYAQGHGMKGSLSWRSYPDILAALENAFYYGFDAVQPTGKRWMFALDMSGSMSMALSGKPISACEAGATLAMVGMRNEPGSDVYGFSHQFINLGIKASDKLEVAARKAYEGSWGGTDCALPMVVASNEGWTYDVFCVITDNETWFGQVHPMEALKRYRKERVEDAKLIVLGMTSTGFSIADPTDAGCLDIVGMDTNVPTAMYNFVNPQVSLLPAGKDGNIEDAEFTMLE